MTPRITQHALVQLGNRYDLSWGMKQFKDALINAKAIFRMSGGEVVPFYIPSEETHGYAVVNSGSVVTVLTAKQAFVNCPRAVFTFLVRKGELTMACNLRSYYKTIPIKVQDANSVRYPASCDTVWCAFKYLEGSNRK